MLKHTRFFTGLIILICGLIAYNWLSTKEQSVPLLSHAIHPVYSLHIKTVEEQFSLTRRGNDWTFSYPTHSIANAQIIERILSEVQQATMERTGIESKSMYPLYGLDPKQNVTLDIQSSKGSMTQIILGVGPHHSIYALTGGTKEIVKTNLTAHSLSRLKKKPLLTGLLIDQRSKIEQIEIRMKDDYKHTVTRLQHPLEIGILQFIPYQLSEPSSLPQTEMITDNFIYKLFITFDNKTSQTVYVANDNTRYTAFIPGTDILYTLDTDYQRIIEKLLGWAR